MSTIEAYVGIDPGIEGAVAAIRDGSVSIEPTPLIPGGGPKGRNTYDPCGMSELLQKEMGRIYVVIEKQQAMPGQGVTSMFTIGYGYGLWLGILTGLRIPHRIVTAQAWKKVLLAGEPKGKMASCLVAQRMFPDAARLLLKTPRSRKPDHNRADALLIAEFGRMCYDPNAGTNTG